MAARTLAVAALVSVAAAQTVPINSVTVDTRACLPPFDSLPFCDTGLSIDERVDDLVTRLWAGGNDAVIPFLLTARNYNKSALPALGLPEYGASLAPPAAARPLSCRPPDSRPLNLAHCLPERRV